MCATSPEKRSCSCEVFTARSSVCVSERSGGRLIVSVMKFLFLSIFCSSLFFNAQATTYPLEDLEPGQTGYAVTAGAGNVLERFPVEILALQYDVGTGFPLVLIRASGDFIERSGGIAAGMSGSPVYLPLKGEDALLGAIGFTFPSSEVGLGLVTPIETMRRAEPGAQASTLFNDHPEPFGDMTSLTLEDAVPVRTPLLMAGLSERASRSLEPLFEGQTSPLPVQSGARWTEQSEQDAAYSLEPGSAVSVQLVRGDIAIGAVGTVTLIEDGKLWAFGHPFLGQGGVSLALAPAYVSYIVPSDDVPFKLADNGRRILGTITQDRPYAISGLVGEQPNFIPVTLTLNGDAGSVTKRFEVTNDERFYGPLLAAASVQAFDEVLEEVSEGTADIAWEIALVGGETVRILEQISDSADIAAASAGLAAQPLELLAQNVFEDPNVERVNLTISYEKEERFADIVEVVREGEGEVMPGEVVTAYVRLQPYRAEPDVETLRIRVPDKLSGTVDLTVRGGLEPGDTGDGEPLLSFDELLEVLRQNDQSSEVIVEAYVEDEVRELARISLPYPVYGNEVLTIEVVGEEGAATGGESGGAPGGEGVPPTEEVPEPPVEDNPPLEPDPFPDDPDENPENNPR